MFVHYPLFTQNHSPFLYYKKGHILRLLVNCGLSLLPFQVIYCETQILTDQKLTSSTFICCVFVCPSKSVHLHFQTIQTIHFWKAQDSPITLHRPTKPTIWPSESRTVYSVQCFTRIHFLAPSVTRVLYGAQPLQYQRTIRGIYDPQMAVH